MVDSCIITFGPLQKSAVASAYALPVRRMRLFTAKEMLRKSAYYNAYYNIVDNRFFVVGKNGILNKGVLA